MVVLEIVCFLLAGLLAGTLAGLLGIGGGIIFVPSQMLVYSAMGLPEEARMKTAIGTSLATIIFTAMSSVRAHSKRKNVRWELIYQIAVGIILGAILGTVFARLIPSRALEIIFGVFIICVGIYFYFKKTLKEHKEHEVPGYFLFNLIGVGIGAFSAMLGVGGGVLTVPTLAHFHVPLRNAIGTASAVGFILSFCGASAFLFPGIGHEVYMPYSIGYIYFPALIPMAIGAVVAAPFGVHLTHTLPVVIIKRIFAGIVVVAGILMIVR